MKMRKSFCLVLVLGVLAVVSVTACHADDVVVPGWRGTAGTTYEQWGFDTDANPTPPEVINNPYGGATAIVVVGQYGSGWLDQLSGLGSKTGFWDLGSSGTITLNIANSPIIDAYKDIWLQVTYFRDITQAPEVDIPGAVRLGGETRLVEHVDTGGDWLLDQSRWRIEPNPSSETIVITSDVLWGALVNQVVVDTRCAAVPEPASLTALLLGCGAVLLRRRSGR